MFGTSISHEKDDLVNLLLSLLSLDCPFRKEIGRCPLLRAEDMTESERYHWLQSMETGELEKLYQLHNRCAQLR
jgi:hypothetical protein